jgi:thiol:disulfide interchange protein/DsbC/DsbD-like thiol-disulfide interchange protein
MRLLLLLAVLFGGLSSGPASAQSLAHISVDIVPASQQPAPGRPMPLIVRMTPQTGWHGYWSNPGDSGLPLEVAWKAPAGVTFGPLQHPAPTMLELAGIASYVHAGPASLVSNVTLPKDMPIGTKVPIEASLRWLACSETLCVPEQRTIGFTLTAGSGAADAANAHLVKTAQNALPSLVRNARFDAAADTLTLSVPDSARRLDPARTRFFPASDSIFAAGTGQRASRTADGVVITIGQATIDDPDRIVGVVSDGRTAYSISATRARIALVTQKSPTAALDTNSLSVAPPAATSGKPAVSLTRPANSDGPMAAGGLLLTLLAAIAGGVLLNLMPCVFPILSLKALALAQAGRGDARREAIAYTVGSALAALALGGVLIALRAAGSEAGWAFQLQDPRFVLLLLALSAAITLNLAGLFELPTAVTSPGRDRGAFATGALASLVATPCSGPFMGVALGAAMAMPPVQALVVFAGLGFGVALPFLLIGFIPAWRRRLPRPGAWMQTLRHILAIPMLATTVALAWLLGRQAGVDGMAIGVAVVAMTGALLWWAGLRQRCGSSARGPALALVAALVVVTVAVDSPAPGQAASLDIAARPDAPAREPFTEARLAELRRAGTPVFVDFTADWCLSCKVNERIAIDTDRTRKAFRNHGVVTLVGDWTRGDPAITRFLKRHGRNSIPFYLFYEPGAPAQTLPQILAPATLSDFAGKGTI